MPLASPLSTLVTVLQSVCQQASDNADLLKKNEAATRAALIDPILRTLGWDTADVRMVEPERTIGGELRVDYLLHDFMGKPQVVIEAKCLGSVLDKHGYVSKVLGYALGFKVQTVFITDGLHWHCYSDLHKGTSDPTFFELTSDIIHSSLQLIQRLDVAYFGYISKQSTYSPLTQQAAPLAAEVSSAKIGKVSQPSATKAAANIQDNFVDLSQVNTMHLQPGQKPNYMRLPDGSLRPIKKWKDILVEASLFVLNAKPAISLPLPDKAGRKRYLLTTKKPAIGASTPTTHQGQTVFIYTHYSATDCIANALYILSQVNSPGKAAVSF